MIRRISIVADHHSSLHSGDEVKALGQAGPFAARFSPISGTVSRVRMDQVGKPVQAATIRDAITNGRHFRPRRVVSDTFHWQGIDAPAANRAILRFLRQARSPEPERRPLAEKCSDRRNRRL
jgi:hypothetical protein